MTLSNSYLAYEDVYKFFDRALEARKGIRIEYGEERIARYQASRFNKARSLDRERNTKLHAEGTELYGHSIYDAISIRIRVDDADKWYIVLVKIAALADDLNVQDLGDEDDSLHIPKSPQGTVQLELVPIPVDPKVRRI